jgi:hypothetical protein
LRKSTHNVVDLRFLALGGALRHPSHANAIAAVENIQFLERNLWLRALGGHELSATNEGWRNDIERFIITSIDNDRDG